MYEIALIQKMVTQNQKDILKITKKVCKKKAWNCYRNLSKEEKDKKENMVEIDTKICLKKIN